MYMRLGFAVAVNVNPDVLLVDEVLAVGDEAFTHKCLDKFRDFRRRGKTVLLVTHSLGLVERLCDEAVWLDGGEKHAEGDSKRVVDAYLTAVEQSEERSLAAASASAGRVSPVPAANMFQATEGRWGSGDVEIVRVDLLAQNGEPSFVFHAGEPMSIRLNVRAAQPTSDFVFGVGLFNADGICCFGTNTEREQMQPDRLVGDADVTFAIDSLDLVEGSYKLDVAVHKRDGAPYDYHRLLYTFRVASRTHDVGIFRPRHHWTFSSNIRFR
jgi:lipopolysaccharide transport system ATP-binding protein